MVLLVGLNVSILGQARRLDLTLMVPSKHFMNFSVSTAGERRGIE